MQQMNYWHDRQSLARQNDPTRLPQVELEITRGRVRNRVRLMRGTTFLIGSGRDCDLVLGDPQFEELHSYLLLGPEGLVLRHLGFPPELTVDGRPVRKVVLWNRARIRTGPFEFRVHIRHLGGDGGSVAGNWTGAEWAGAELASPGALRVFRGLEEQISGASCRAGRVGRRPPQWRHLSELLLAP
jgi:hypothetical protein